MRKNTQRLWTAPFILLLIINLLNGIAGQMTFPLIAKFSLSIGADLTLASTTAGLMSLAALFVCPFAGLLSDRFSRRKIMMISFIGYAIFLFLHVFVKSMPMLIIFRLVTGTFFSVISVTAVAFSTAFIPKYRMAEGLGYSGLANILAQAVGPAISLALVERFGYGACFGTAAGCAAMALVLMLFLREPKGTEEAEAVEQKAPSRKITLDSLFAWQFVLFMLLAMLFSSCNSLILTYLTIIADERHIQNIALYFTVYSIGMVVIRPFMGRLTDKKGAFVVTLPAIIVGAAGIILVGVSYTLILMLCAALLMSFGQGAGLPSLQAHTIKKLDAARAGVATSTIMIGMNLGHALTPMIGSFFVKAYGYEAMLIGFGVVLLTFGSLFLWLQYRKEKKEK